MKQGKRRFLRGWMIGASLAAMVGWVVGGPAAASPLTPAAAHTTVLPLSEGPAMLEAVGLRGLGAGTPHYWRPTAAERSRLEADMPRSLKDYYRQYLGVSLGKQRWILINGFSASVSSEFVGGKADWHQHTVQVMDGGNDFFQATYELHSRQFTGPFFNGLG